VVIQPDNRHVDIPEPHMQGPVAQLGIWATSGDLMHHKAAALAEGECPFTYSVHVYDPEWLRGRRKIESFFIQEVDRDKIVLAGSALE
jgi:hypothetical protein